MIDKADLFRALAGMSPEERAALFGSVSTTPTNTGPKFSAALDRVTEEATADVVNACRRGIRVAMERPGDRDQDLLALNVLAEVDPVLARAAQTNSDYRRKPYAHSLVVAADYLQSEARHAKLAAAKRRVPVERPRREKPPDAGAAGAATTTTNPPAKG